MASQALDAEMAAFAGEWVRSMLDKDVEAASRLRAEGYRLVLGDGEEMDRGSELAIIAAPDHRYSRLSIETLSAEPSGDEALVRAEIRVSGNMAGTRIDSLYGYRFRCARRGGGWAALEAEVAQLADYLPPQQPAPPPPPFLKRAAGALRRRLPTAGIDRARARPRFQQVAYLPYAPGADYALAPHAPPVSPDQPLPVPPEELWLGYDYEAHGETHVRTMLDIATASGLELKQGDRVLDLGCGAGRMIRHLRPIAERCEIWGADISAPHISWCKHHLSPPFHFATTTKVPHLPFEDRSFSLIYCGSLFTHIDDLADAWLLELKRILRPDGRLYVTIHDEETIRLFNTPRYGHAEIVKRITASPTFQDAGDGWGMFTIGRDEGSQVFYRRSYFERMAGQAFDTLSITPEAYHYQTAFLLARKDRPAQ